MAKGEGVSESRKAVPGGTRMPLLVTVVAIVVIGLIYFAYYRNQVTYYTGRNLRLLATLTKQVEGRVTLFGGFVRAAAEEGGVPGGDVSPKLGVEETPDGWQVRWQPFMPQLGPVPQRCASFDDLLRPVFTRRIGAAFDVLLVADADGTILHSVRPPVNASTLLYRDVDSDQGPEDDSATALGECDKPAPAEDANAASPLVLTKLDAIAKKTGWRGDPKPLDLGTLATATTHMPVTVNGEDYVLFSEPYTFSRAAFSLDGKQHQWIVMGLVSASRFRYDVTAVSMNLILLAVAVVLLGICCWPFLRIALIDPRQALTITDVVLIVVCTIVGATVLTIALLDMFAYRRLSGAADEQLMRFSEGVNDDFARNVGRGVDVLNRVEALTAGRFPGSYDIPAEVRADPVVAAYPYVDSISWIDADGVQQVKFSHGVSRRQNVARRGYFRDAMAEQTWTVDERAWSPKKKQWISVGRHPYVLEWVRSMATGDVRAVLAKKTADPAYPVLALATELIDVSHAIAPPGVELAIIDENGEVVYHSDAQRIGYENFFAEADQNRELRSAVLARRAGYVAATYWGEDQSLYVRPLNGSPWTLVTFRAKRITRVLNVEGVLLALMMLLLSGTPYFLVYAIVLIAKPRYRAPRLWPDEKRWGDYLRLSILLIALMALFRLNNYALTPWSSFLGVLILPGIAIVTAYLMLHRKGTPKRFAIAIAVWIILYASLISKFLTAEAEPRVLRGSVLANALMIVAALGTAALTLLFLSPWNGGARLKPAIDKLRARVGYATLYRLCGALLLTVGVAMVVAGFFRISRHVEAELLVKYAQLRAAADLEHRIGHLHEMSVLGKDSPQILSDVRYDRFATVFGSNWSLQPRPPHLGGPEPPDVTACAASGGEGTIPSSAAVWMPALYEDSIAIRPLFQAQSDDDLWHWCLPYRDPSSSTRPREDELIKLVRRIRFEPAVVGALGLDPKQGQSIVISSPLTPSKLDHALAEADLRTRATLTQSAPVESVRPDLPLRDLLRDKPQYYATVAFVALLLMLAFWYVADFIATRVLLIDVREPIWLSRVPLSPTLGDHIFLVRRDRKLDALTGANLKGKLPFLDVSFEKLHASKGWSRMLKKLDSSAAGQNVRIVDFEYGIHDPVVNDLKLQWLERLLELADRTVIVVSTVSATYIRTTPPPKLALRAAVLWYYDRWRAMLERFVWVTAEELELRGSTAASANTWLAKETQHNAFLLGLRDELEDTDPRYLLDEIGERAESYYAGLWASCHDDEKLLLYNLAHNGLANGRNRRVLRRLIARGFVRREPNFELFSETFRRYVLAACRREDLVSRSREERGASTWDTLRVPFFVILVSLLLLLVTTQKDLMTTTTALATGLTTGIPLIMKLIGAFTERRLDGPPDSR